MQTRIRHTVSPGLTVLEVMLAMGIISISVLLIIGLLARFLSAQSSTAAQTAARLMAKEVLDLAAATGPDGWGFPNPSDLTGSRNLILPNEKKPTEFKYRLLTSELRSDPRDQGVLYELEVEVWWWTDKDKPWDDPDATTARTESGNLFVKAQRVVYVEN